MTQKKHMPHLLIFLPGIMGSRLQKNGKDIWGLSNIPFWQHLRAIISAGSIPDLALRDDDWQHELNDGVVATELIADLHSVPWVVSHAGYSPFVNAINAFFDVVQGSIIQPTDKANFYPFPYDWRRDNRANARKLKAFVDTQLARWRTASGNPNAQVILIGHSMGGLVSRYYVEVLGGWQNCHTLITIGTPHWGAVDAVEAICNGRKIGLADFSSVVRTLTSTHQLLPVFKMLKLEDGSTVRVSEADLPNLERTRAASARSDFHAVIWDQAKANRTNPAYKTRTIPWVGVEQDTLLSAQRNGGQVTTSISLPAGFDPLLGDGDGTVPRFSAIPPELSAENGRFAVEQHGWLTNSAQAVDPILATIVTLLAGQPVNQLGGEKPVPAINLRLKRYIALADEPEVGVRLAGPGADKRQLRVKVTRVDKRQKAVTGSVAALGEKTVDVALPKLPAGLYQVEVKPARVSKNSPAAVHGVFEVAGE